MSLLLPKPPLCNFKFQDISYLLSLLLHTPMQLPHHCPFKNKNCELLGGNLWSHHVMFQIAALNKLASQLWCLFCLLFKIIFFHLCLLLFHTPAPNAADLSNHKSVKTQTSLGPERGRVNQVSDEWKQGSWISLKLVCGPHSCVWWNVTVQRVMLFCCLPTPIN